MKSNHFITVGRLLCPSLSKGQAVVYLLRLKSGAVYIGSSTDLEQRLDDHQTGQACRTTHFDPPVSIIRVEACDSFTTARRREAQLKRWSRAKKEALVIGDLKALSALSRSD